MKTKLFFEITRRPDDAKELLGDLLVLLRLEPKQRTACIEGLLLIAQKAMTRRQQQTIVDKIARDHQIDALSALSAFHCLRFFLDAFRDEDYKGADTADIVEDVTASWHRFEVSVEDNAVLVLTDLITQLRGDVLTRYERHRKERSVVVGIHPSLQSFGTTVELRGVISKPFRIGMTADNSYDPQLRNVVPVISVNLSVDSGVVDEFSFQASESEIAALIEELRSSLIAMKQLKKLANVSEIQMTANLQGDSS